MNAIIQPPILPVSVDGIPASLMDSARWAPWRAVWNEKKQKYEKAPHRADRPGSGLSNKSTRGWTSFHEALRAYRENLAGKPAFDRDGKPVQFGGVGYLVTGRQAQGKAANVFEPAGVVGVDLDHCRDASTGEIAPWAAEVIAQLDSYTEVSPSGTGLRVMVRADLAEDVQDHNRGIEIYGGTSARFVTITGQHYAGSPRDVRAPKGESLAGLVSKYRRQRTKAEVEDLHLPPLLSAMDLPDLEDLDLPPHARNFLSEGPDPGADRSGALFATSIALAQSGCTREQILSILEANEYAMEVALDHRRQDYDKAMRYLWKDHCRAGAARAADLTALDLAEFEELDAPAPADDAIDTELAELLGVEVVQAASVADDFENLDDGDAAVKSRDLAPVKVPRFTPMLPAQFLQRQPPKWLIKHVMPQAGLAVIFGASGSGKTFFTLDMCAAMVRGADWRGMPCVQGRGAYVVAEGVGGFRNRLDAYMRHYGIDPHDFGMGIIADAPNLMDKAQVKEVIAALKAFGPLSFVVVDTYARVMVGGNENDSKDAGLVIAHCAAIHKATGAMVILVHHSGKDATKGARGSGALRAAADVEIEVVATREYRAATITKMKDGEDGKQYNFKLAETQIGEDEDGFPITSCVVEHTAALPQHQRKGEPKGDIEKAVYAFLVAAAELDDTPVRRDDVATAVADKLEYDPTIGKKDRRKEVVKRALDILERKNITTSDGITVRIAE